MRSLALLAITASVAGAQSLSQKEQAIARAVDSHNTAAIQLLERVVNINSGTQNIAGVKRVGDVFKAELDALGFRTRWVDGASFKRAGHLIAEKPGPGPKILLIGHLDTVFEPSSPFQKFVRLNDTTATGPGIIDMKGGDVIAVHALRALKDVGVLDSMNVVIVMHGDEEDAGSPQTAARQALIDAAKGAQYAIGFEDGPGDPKLAVIARRSSTSWTLTTTGTPGHSSQIFRADIGAGAIYEAARILNQFREKLSGEQYLTFNPGMIIGGSKIGIDTAGIAGTADGKPNVIAGSAIVTGDIRTISPEQYARAKRTMEDIVAASLPLTTAKIVFDEGYPPMAPSDGNRRLLAMYDQVSKDLGFWPVTGVDPSRAGAADVAFVSGIVPMIIDGVGLSGWDDHSANEKADLGMLPVQTKRAAVLLNRLRLGGTLTTQLQPQVQLQLLQG